MKLRDIAAAVARGSSPELRVRRNDTPKHDPSHIGTGWGVRMRKRGRS
jgi:hypothetical protein